MERHKQFDHIIRLFRYDIEYTMSRKAYLAIFLELAGCQGIRPQAIPCTRSLASSEHFSLLGERILGAQSRIFDMALTITWINWQRYSSREAWYFVLQWR